MAIFRGCGSEWVLAWIWQVKNKSAILNQRKRVQQKRKLSDRDILVGGKLPLVPGLIRSRIEDISLNILSKLLNTHWNIVKDYIE